MKTPSTHLVRQWFGVMLAAQLATNLSASFLDDEVPAEDGVVFRSGGPGYDTFRIPALIEATNGDLLAFAEGRVGGRSDSGDIDLVLRRSGDGGDTWSDLEIVWDDGENTCGVYKTPASVWHFYF